MKEHNIDRYPSQEPTPESNETKHTPSRVETELRRVLAGTSRALTSALAINVDLLAACKRSKYLAACIRDASSIRDIGPDVEGIIDACNSAVAQAEGRKA